MPPIATTVLLLLLLLAPPPLPACHAHAPGGGSRRRKILSLGGNGMLGTETLRRLLPGDVDGGGGGFGDDGQGGWSPYDVTLVSRGNWPFDSHDLIAPRVKTIRCDRGGGSGSGDSLRTACPDLATEIDSAGEYYAVLDFSGYHRDWVRDVVNLLREGNVSVRVYVYVSTDSVYEVSEFDSGDDEGYDDGRRRRRRTREVDAVRPVDGERRAELNARDPYGDEKLGGEEVLAEQRRRGTGTVGGDGGGGFPYVLLRFADVVGPRDPSHRFALYWMWIRTLGLRPAGHADLDPLVPPLHVRDDVVEAASVTFVEDGAAAIMAAMDAPDGWDEAYNVACQEVFNVTEVLLRMCDLMGNDGTEVERWGEGGSGGGDDDWEEEEEEEEREALSFYPSVTRGPLDVSKARERLGFVPTPLDVVLRRTIDWYELEFRRNEEFREEFVEDYFLDMIVDEDRRDDVYRIIMGEFEAEVDHDEL